MKTKFVELFQIYKYGILKKIVAQKHLPHQDVYGVFHTKAIVTIYIPDSIAVRSAL